LGDRSGRRRWSRRRAVDRGRSVAGDLVGGLARPDQGRDQSGISEKGELLSARIAMAVAIVVATYLGLNPPGFAAQTVALAFGLAAASIFPALMMGIFSTKVNNTGAVAGMLAGLIVTLIYIFLHKGWFFIPGTNSFTDADPLLGTIKSTSFGAVGAAINFAVAYLVSRHDQGNCRRRSRTWCKACASR
jgi:cation/acetate symporter